MLKLLQGEATVETRYRLKKWTQLGEGKNAEWVKRGAVDAENYFNQCKDDYDKLMYSYNFEWLRQHYERTYKDTVC